MENLTITLTANEILLINTILKEDMVRTMQKSVQFEKESLGSLAKSYRDLSLFQSRISDKIVDQVAKQSKKGLERILNA
jgi:hypothetical protein